MQVEQTQPQPGPQLHPAHSLQSSDPSLWHHRPQGLQPHAIYPCSGFLLSLLRMELLAVDSVLCLPTSRPLCQPATFWFPHQTSGQWLYLLTTLYPHLDVPSSEPFLLRCTPQSSPDKARPWPASVSVLPLPGDNLGAWTRFLVALAAATQHCCSRAALEAICGTALRVEKGWPKLGSRQQRSRSCQLLPDDGGEEFGRVHIGDGKAGSRGKLPHHGQHSDHHGKIWWRRLVSHVEGG